MLKFPEVPTWWKDGPKFMHLDIPFDPPDWLVGYDTETHNGEIITQQLSYSKWTEEESKDDLDWINRTTVLDKFLDRVGKMKGVVCVYCFNAKFDLAILLRKYIEKFLFDDFTVYYKRWKIEVFCSRNWYAYFYGEGVQVIFLDVQNYFSGSLEKVAQSFRLKLAKLQRPDGLGSKKFTSKDKKFVEYALMDSKLCYELGKHILKMHQEFDIPFSTSSANFAEKVFRRQFLEGNMRIQFPKNFDCLRTSELAYHGGKNGYYHDTPLLVEKCYEYDFNSAYPSAMYDLPSFIGGEFQHVSFYSDKYVGVYQVTGTVYPCRYGILYDNYFNYFRYGDKQKVNSICTSYELKEAIKCQEFKIESIQGWIWKPSPNIENPLREYSKFFWEKKNKTPKSDVRYLFYKLLLNSLYGKWIQRNPLSAAKYTYSKNELQFTDSRDTSGGLYQPFIASLITGYVRARLHKAEHYFNAIESSTDSVKTIKYDKCHDSISRLGAMQLQHHTCDKCKKEVKSVTGLFVRNRLNVLMDSKKHILKAALHGYWGKAEELYRMYKENRVWYQKEKMSGIREALKQENKPLFEMHTEERSLNIDWSRLKKINSRGKVC